MWVRSQDKKELIDVTRFSVSKNSFSKDKAAIVGYYGGSSTLEGNAVIIGNYADQEEASRELDRIQGILTVYNMK